jgi:hypothetical protein
MSARRRRELLERLNTLDAGPTAPGMLETGVIGREDAVVTERHRMPEEVIGDAGL